MTDPKGEALAINGGPQEALDLDVPEWPPVTEASEQYVVECLQSGDWCSLGEDATWVSDFERSFADYHDAKHAVAVANGTVALQLALRVCGVRPGDEVIVPSYTFIATASAVASIGAIPRLVDVDPQTYNIDAESVRDHITEDTVGVVGVHFAGYPIDFDEILPIVDENDMFLIEDCAHAHGTEWKGHKIGTIGDMGAFSLQESKALSSGEGGIVLTDDHALAERAELIQNIGRRQDSHDYHHHLLSSNYRLSEQQGALLMAQLEDFPEQVNRKERHDRILREELRDVSGIELKPDDERITSRGHYYFNFSYNSEEFGGLPREKFLELLNAEGVPANSSYGPPLHKQPAFEQHKVSALLPRGAEPPLYQHQHLPGAEEVSERIVAIPHQVLLADEVGVRSIASSIKKIQMVAQSGEVFS